MHLRSFINPFTSIVSRFCRPHLTRVTIGAGALVIVDLVDITLPLIMKGAFDALGDYDRFIWFALGYSSLLVLQAALRLTYRTLFPLAQCAFAHSLRTGLARSMISSKDDGAIDKKAGEAVTLMTSDAEQAACVLNDGVVIGMDATLYLLLVPSVMIWISPLAALFALTPLIAVPIIARRGERAITVATERVQQALTALSSFIDEKLRNHETIILFSLRDKLTNLLEKLSTQQRQRVIESTYADTNLSGAIQLCGALAMTILVILGTLFIHQGALSIGGFVALYQYLQMLFWPLIALGLYISVTQKARVASGRIETVLELGSSEPESNICRPIIGVPVITLSAVSVIVPERKEAILNTINLTIGPRERIAIVGPTGSGKTTLLEAIAGIRPYNGNISFSEGTSWFTAEESVTLCPQIPRLFCDNIERNLLFWNRGSPKRSAMNELLDKLFTAEEKCNENNNTFLTRMVDARSGLSGGQRQRLTLARTLLSTSPVVLLDNPFSALDPAREAQTISQLDKWIGDRTLIVVTNRLAPLALVTRIIVLVDGKIVQDGSSKDLTNDGTGWFARFFHQQLLNSSSSKQVGHE